MKKLLTFFLTALLAFSVGWAEDVELDFTSNSSWNLPTTSTVDENSYSNGTYTITLKGTTGAGYRFVSNGSYLILGKSGAYLTLPTFTKDVTKIVVQGRSGASGKVTQNIYVGETAVSTETTGATGTYTYEISNNYQSAGNVFTLKVTNANNTQITKITITLSESSTPSSHKYYHRVTSADELVDGKKYLIVYEQGNKFLGGISQNTTNGYYGIAVDGPTINGNVVDIDGYSDIKELTLGAESSNNYTLHNGDGYLCYYSGDGSSPLNTQSSVQNYSRWRMVAKGCGYVVRNYSATSRYIQYDASVPAFAAYNTSNNSKEDAYLYVEGEADVLTAAATPTFSPENGTEFYGSQDVTITSATTGATIYYTTDGSDPTSSSASIASGETVTLTSSCTLKAIAMALGYNPSEVATGSFTRETLPMPTFSPVGGTYDIGTTVTVEINAVDGAAIYYTLDGSTPVANRAAYSGPITITENTTLKAIAVLNGETSEIATAEYVFAAPSPTCPATIDFDNNATTTLTGTGYSVSAGSDFVTGSSSSTTYEEADGIRVGSGSSTGSLTLTLASDYNKVKKVVINAMRYGSDEGVVANVTTSNGESKSANIANESSFAEYVFDNFTGTPVTTLTISNSASRKRFYIDYITIYYECAPVARLTAEPNPLNINDDNSANGKTGTFSVTGENLGTDDVGVTLDNSHSTNFTFTTSDEWWGFNNNNGSVNGTVTVTYTGHALSATGQYNIANNLTSTSERINYLYTGPIYVIGDVNNTWWNTTQGAQLTRDENGIYTATVSVQQSNDAGYISFTKQLGADQSGNQFGPVAFNWNLAGNEGTYQPIDTLGNAYNIRLVPGTYTITINPATNEFMITPYVITVTISPEDGSTFTGSTVSGTITDSPAGTIEWSTDGENWQTYNDGFTATAANVGDQVTIYARSTSNGVTSEVVTATYTRVAAPAPAAPTFSRGSGDVSKGTVITITAPEGTTLYVDGQQVTSPYDVVINRSTTISAYCVNDEGTQSEIVTNTYKISAVCEASIVFSGSGGTGDGNTNIAGRAIPDEYIESGTDLIASSSTLGGVYNGKGTNGLKMGSGSYTGSFTINLNTQAEGWKVSKIIVNALAWSASEGQLQVTTSADATGSTQSLSAGDFANYEFGFDGSEITSFTVSTTSTGKRCYVKSVTLVYNCGAVVEAPVITPATGTDRKSVV